MPTFARPSLKLLAERSRISKAAIRSGMRWAGSLFIWRRTNATRPIRSLSWPLTPIAFPSKAKPQHLPLGRALEEYAGAKNRAVLAALLSPVQRAAEQSKLARELLDSRAVFHPQVWRPEQAFSFLQNIPLFEQSGLIVRIPDWWKAGRPPRPQVTVRIGEAKGKLLGADSLMDFEVQLTLEGEPLTEIGAKSHPAIRQRAGLAQRQVGRSGPGQAPGGSGALEKR